jgi:4-amino-4-deoxy-L-arabinose transferase-like glycosyltransferase
MFPEVLRAKTLSGFSAVDGQRGNWGGATLLPGVRLETPRNELQYYALFSRRAVTPPEERLPFPQLELSPDVNPRQYGDQMTQHPPLYYGVVAAVIKATGAYDNWRYDRTLALMRLVSVGLVGCLPLMAFSVTRTLTGNRRLADVAALLPLGIPQLASLGGSVSNDALVVFLGGAVTVLLARVLRGDRSWRCLWLLAGVLGLALLTKGTLLILVPVVGMGVVVGARRAPTLPWLPTLLRLAAVWGGAFAVGGWWWAVNIVRYGTVQPQGLLIPPVDRPRDSLSQFSAHWWGRVTNSFWGYFGWLELPLASVVVVLLTVAGLVAVALSIRRRGIRVDLLVLLSFFALTTAALFVQTRSLHLANGQFAGMQGRYLFGGVTAVFAAAAIGIGTLGREGGRFQRWLPLTTLPTVLVVAAYGQWVAFRGYWVEVGWSLADAAVRMRDMSPLPAWLLYGVMFAVACSAFVALVVSVRSALRFDAHEETGGDGEGPSTRRSPQVRSDSAASVA